ncbi:Fc.00g094130.m01.CDS01 [Cosmosporella sp. VM-42]
MDPWEVATDQDGNLTVKSDALGEATHPTATAAAAAPASGNYRQDLWELRSANAKISAFLNVLVFQSWGNSDSEGWSHAIRHPEWLEFYGEGNERNRPLSGDAFN